MRTEIDEIRPGDETSEIDEKVAAVATVEDETYVFPTTPRLAQAARA
jgi:hypothetical protein